MSSLNENANPMKKIHHKLIITGIKELQCTLDLFFIPHYHPSNSQMPINSAKWRPLQINTYLTFEYY